jgi:hypothetical protein
MAHLWARTPGDRTARPPSTTARLGVRPRTGGPSPLVLVPAAQPTTTRRPRRPDNICVSRRRFFLAGGRSRRAAPPGSWTRDANDRPFADGYQRPRSSPASSSRPGGRTMFANIQDEGLCFAIAVPVPPAFAESAFGFGGGPDLGGLPSRACAPCCSGSTDVLLVAGAAGGVSATSSWRGVGSPRPPHTGRSGCPLRGGARFGRRAATGLARRPPTPPARPSPALLNGSPRVVGEKRPRPTRGELELEPWPATACPTATSWPPTTVHCCCPRGLRRPEDLGSYHTTTFPLSFPPL